MEMERDFVTFTDDDGNEFELDVIDYFDFEGDEYAVLMDLAALETECDCEEDEECECMPEQDVYIMKVVVNGEMEEFVPADEDKMDQLAEIVEQRLSEGCCCDCEDDECCDDDCDCGCHDHE